jgi:preprotein translocase subunit SecD
MALRTLLALPGILAISNGFAQSAPAAPVTLAVHLLVACSTQGAGRPVRLPGVDASLCLDGTPFLTQGDVQSAELHENSKGRPVIFLTFHEDAAVRELEITRKNIGNRVGIVVNGRVAAAPAIAASSRFLYIDTGYAAKQVQALVAAFNRQAGNR